MELQSHCVLLREVNIKFVGREPRSVISYKLLIIINLLIILIIKLIMLAWSMNTSRFQKLET